MMRLGILTISVAMLLCNVACANEKPLVGAIRWDAWYGDGTGVNGEVERTLSPKRWQWRAPFFAEVVSEDRIQIRGGPEAIRKEIDFAADAGIDYWAFCIYEADDNLSRALNLYLEAPNRERIKFCMNLQGLHFGMGGLEKALERLDLYVEYMQRPEYQRVLGGRPLVYIFNIENAIAEGALDAEEETADLIRTLREKAMKAGLKNPYIVVQNQPETASALAAYYKADAIGNYCVATHWENQSFKQLTDYAEGYFWNAYLETGLEIVPIATAGWDTRPRIQSGVSWFPDIKEKSLSEYHEPPTPAELATHIRKALDFMEKHRSATPANAVLIYAWNEFDEGGWLCPTLGEGTARLEALKPVLRPQTDCSIGN